MGLCSMKSVALLFSAGRDSFLAACRLVEDGYFVHLIGADNGCMSNVDGICETAKRLVEHYGTERILWGGVCSIASEFNRLRHVYGSFTLQELAAKYPALRPAQVTCLLCHTCMYHMAINYCHMVHVNMIAEGARANQRFIIVYPQMRERYERLAAQNGIGLLWPVYDVKSDWERKLELAGRGFVPKTFEPQCWLGCPLGSELTSNEVDSLIRFYDDIMQYEEQD